ncbi:MAG: response regulator transcription factor [Tissierellia bacterium]|nr:response regulator transcription factor [Tissierellia bacterium]
MKYTILIAEDDEDILNILKLYLESKDYRVIGVPDGQKAYEVIQENDIDLAIFDVMMPKIDGFNLTQKVRQDKNIPIIILTAKIEDNDKILGLNLGADDYLTKPFNPLEVLARVNALLRRSHSLNQFKTTSQAPNILKLGDLEVDMDTYSLRKKGREISLTPTEYKLLVFMLKYPGRVFTKSQLCQAVNGDYYENYENAITVHIFNLRDKIEDDPKAPKYLKNIRGVGYKIEKFE